MKLYDEDCIDDFIFKSYPEDNECLPSGLPPPNAAIDRFLGACPSSHRPAIPQKEPTCQVNPCQSDDSDTSSEEPHPAPIDRVKDNLEAAGLVNVPLLRRGKTSLIVMCTGCENGPLLEYRQFDGHDHYLCLYCAKYLPTLAKLRIKISRKRPQPPASVSPPPQSAFEPALPPLPTFLNDGPLPASQKMVPSVNWDWPASLSSGKLPVTTSTTPLPFPGLPASAALFVRPCKWCGDSIKQSKTRKHWLCGRCAAHYHQGRSKQGAFLRTRKPRGDWTKPVLLERGPSLYTKRPKKKANKSAFSPPASVVIDLTASPDSPIRPLVAHDSLSTPMTPASLLCMDRRPPWPNHQVPQAPLAFTKASLPSSPAKDSIQMSPALPPFSAVESLVQLAFSSPMPTGHPIEPLPPAMVPIETVAPSLSLSRRRPLPKPATSCPSCKAPLSDFDTPCVICRTHPVVRGTCQFCLKGDIAISHCNSMLLCPECRAIHNHQIALAHLPCEWCQAENTDNKPGFWRGIIYGVRMCTPCYNMKARGYTMDEARRLARKSRGSWIVLPPTSD